ncbi:prophage tail fiber N-terminal domain-containing protein [Escherichia coli]|uniref:prophage tail fiber N-terminal domain-containing protein n=1 Tax=Escherichia coli TaxID=562 RepID=UPI001C172B39|nr:prophage tail fiber N-terminal domain-containing protein [Escherichia coli]HBD5698611.1 prophage tail fiber N-terminal domain-containing protein [Escherichia coli]HBD5965763.1 prophage tail fiber N-terminal domain-containing protein [Escherichia coli]HBD6009227.1 prophage tail fiber N-terminal domain-containing protein [Escherichia coli]HCY2441307.1 prophage tail fiber N-terminal domain-containing protein [Escherichia coli]
MTVKISGVLKDGTGKPVQNCTIVLKARRTSSTVVVNTVASENPDEAGRYSMDVEYGQYSVTLLVEGFPPSHAGTITVYEGSRPGTLNDFLGAMTEDDARPEALRRFELMVNEVARHAGASSQSAAAAKKSETAAASSKNAAKTSETNAANSAQAAAASQTASANSATAAKKSETNAKNSETAAKTSETNAKSSQTAAKTSETNAKASETAAKSSQDAAAESESAAANSAKASAASQTAAKASEDAAREYASQAAEPYKYVLQPLPDVWIPFNDSLDMITGFSPSYKKIVIGDDEITIPGDKIVKFKRASEATYIDKSGGLCIASVDEPRFEKMGLLIEGQRTNTLYYSNTPSLWNYLKSALSVTSETDEYGFTYGTFTVTGTPLDGRATLITSGYPRVISVDANESVTLSCRVKGTDILIRPRVAYVNDDGTSNALVAESYIDCGTGEILKIPNGEDAVNHVIYREANGWLRIEFTYKSPEPKSIHARFEMAAEGRSIQAGDQIMMTTPQFEKGTHASSFIITSGTGATRASDMVTVPVKLNWSTPAISCLVEVNTLWEPGFMPNITGGARILDITTTGDSTDIINQSYMYLGFATRGNKAIITNGNSNAIKEYNSTLARTKRHNIVGFLFSEDRRLQVVVNGVFGALTTSAYQNQKYTGGFITIGGKASSGSRHLFGHVRNLRIWHRELTAAQQGEKI